MSFSTTSLYAALEGPRQNFAAKFLERFLEPLQGFLRTLFPGLDSAACEDIVGDFLTHHYELMLGPDSQESIIDIYLRSADAQPSGRSFTSYILSAAHNFALDQLRRDSRRARLLQDKVPREALQAASFNAQRELSRRAVDEFRELIRRRIQSHCRQPDLALQLLELRWPSRFEAAALSQTEAGIKLGLSEAELKVVRDSLIHAIALALRDDAIASRDPIPGPDIPDPDLQKRARAVWQVLARSCVESLAAE